MSQCGDASTTFTAAYQPIDMAELKSISKPPGPLVATTVNEAAEGRVSDRPQDLMRGRNDYTRASSLRTKPGRTDSFPSISLSCSDKICSWSVLGLQGALISNARIAAPAPASTSRRAAGDDRAPGRVPREWHFDPVYLDGIVVGDVVPPSREQEHRVVGWQPEETVWGDKLQSFRGAVRAEAEWALYGRVQGIAGESHLILVPLPRCIGVLMLS